MLRIIFSLNHIQISNRLLYSSTDVSLDNVNPKSRETGFFFTRIKPLELMMEFWWWMSLRIAWNGLKGHEERRVPRSSADSSNARIFRDTSRGETATRLAPRAIFLARDVSCIRHRWRFFNRATSSPPRRWIVIPASRTFVIKDKTE